MNTHPSMQSLVQRYLAHRRNLGYDLRGVEHDLNSFAQLADREAPGAPITTALAMQWATQCKSTDRGYRSHRLSSVRNFARFCAALDPRTQVPSTHLLSTKWSRCAPHLYTKLQVRQMMRRARRLAPNDHPLRPFLYQTLIGLLYCTGLRIGEALRLQITDLDVKHGTLRVPGHKFSCERILPLAPSTIRALQRYVHLRTRLCPFGSHLFVDRHGRGMSGAQTRKTFRKLTGFIKPNGARPRPRWHDFRHSFASRVIAHWSDHDEPVAHHLLFLSRYLGHKSFQETWWYVSPTPAVLEAASARFQAYQRNPNLL